MKCAVSGNGRVEALWGNNMKSVQISTKPKFYKVEATAVCVLTHIFLHGSGLKVFWEKDLLGEIIGHIIPCDPVTY